MRNINPDEILKRKDYSTLTDGDFKKKVYDYCKIKLDEIDNITENDRIRELKEFPIKKYEIFKLNIDGGKIFLLSQDDIHYNEEKKERELYYSASIAKQICILQKQLSETAIDLVEKEYEEDIKETKEKIEQLKDLDDQEYGLSRFIYSSLEDTDILENYEKSYEKSQSLEIENKKLKEQLNLSEKNIMDLSNKLKFLLDEVEKSRNNLEIKNKNIFQKIGEKIKIILDKNK